MLHIQFLASTFFLILSSVIAFGFGNSDVSTYFFIAALAVSTFASWKSIANSGTLSVFPDGAAVTWRTYLLAATIGITFFGFTMKAATLRPATPDEVTHAFNAVGVPYYDFDTSNVVLAAALHHQPPLHYVASSASLRFWGLGELGARFPSIVFACLTLVALFVLCRENGISTTFALIATLFCGITELFFHFTLDGRPYTAALFTFTLFLASAVRMFLSTNPRSEIYSIIGAGILFVMSVGMQPAFMMLVITFFAPVFANFQWRNVFWFLTANAATAAVTAPVLALVASRAVIFTPNHDLDVYDFRARGLSEKILSDNRWFWDDVFSRNTDGRTALLFSVFLIIAGLYFYSNRKRVVDQGYKQAANTLLGLSLTAAVFFLAITSVFTLFIEHPFGPRHAIINIIILCVTLAVSAEATVRLFSFNKALKLVAALCFFSVAVMMSRNNLRALPNRVSPPTQVWFDARSYYGYLKEIAKASPPNWTAQGYALDLIDTRFIDYSGFFGLQFYSESDFPNAIYINQKPRKNLPVWQYLLDDIRANNTPNEFIFLSLYPYFAGVKSVSTADVPWTQGDGVTIVKFPGLIVTRVEVNAKPLESAIRFFEKIRDFYADLIGKEEARVLSLLLETLTRLHLESHNCQKAEETFKQIHPESKMNFENEFPALLAACKSKK